MTLYAEIPNLGHSLFSTDKVIHLAGWLRFAAKHPDEMEEAIDIDIGLQNS